MTYLTLEQLSTSTDNEFPRVEVLVSWLDLNLFW